MLQDIKLLPYFINEDLFVLPQDRQLRPLQQETAGTHAKPQLSELAASQMTARPQQPESTTTKTTASPAAKKADSPAVNPNLIFGKNAKQLLVLVEDYNHPVMERSDGLLLKDILKAIGYTFDDVAIVNISHCREEVDWAAVNKIPFNTLFSFGISHPKLPFTSTLAPYELEKSGERKFLLADKLSVLRQDRSRKIALWNLLKKLFV